MTARRPYTNTGQLLRRLAVTALAKHGDTPAAVRAVTMRVPARLRRDPTLALAVRIELSAARVRRAGGWL